MIHIQYTHTLSVNIKLIKSSAGKRKESEHFSRFSGLADFATDTNTIFIYRYCMYIVFILQCQIVPNNYQIIVALIAFHCVHCEIRANIVTDFPVALQKIWIWYHKSYALVNDKILPHDSNRTSAGYNVFNCNKYSLFWHVIPVFSECISGTYGINCESQCNTCVHRICDRQDGRCTYGCIEGFKGDDCHLKVDVSGKPFTSVWDWHILE